ncbi:ATP-binding cassette domain-containing protein [[Acholeplasma] multilocale]|uniref:ATP-binding cassette domain-containing protein n=1 Tax=[Acholeplasma] multilocale TaxID=264638 RepID=UPI00047B4A5C|nr:ATP-binding cassette domain-containing protein [[Acholeplasma] multilocale]
MSIKLKNVTIDYGNFLAVDDLSIDIKTGELVSLLGPSGCGKTTALNAIAGLINTTSGQILFDGIDVTDKTSQKRNIGLVFQSYALYTHMNVFKNIAYPLYQSKDFTKKLRIDNKRHRATVKQLNLSKGYVNVLEEQKTIREMFKNIYKEAFKNYEDQEKAFLKKHGLEIQRYLKQLFKNNKNVLLENKMVTYLFDKTKYFYTKTYIDVLHTLLEVGKTLKINKDVNPLFKDAVGFYIDYLNFEISSHNDYLKNLSKTAKVSKRNIMIEQKKYNLSIKGEETPQIDIFNAELNKQIYSEYLEKKNLVNEKYLSDVVSKYNTSIEKFAVEITALLTKETIGEGEVIDLTDQIRDVKKQIFSKKEKIKKLVHETAAKVEIENQLNKKPHELSGGQQQRVAIARAIVKQPKILLLDEPLSNLDAKLRLTTRDWIKRFQQKVGITTIFVTHDQEEALSISDRIFVMNKGVLQQFGTPMEIYNEPKNAFVAKFIGTPNINFIKTEVKNGVVELPSKVKLNLTNKKVKNQTVQVGIRPEHLSTVKNKEHDTFVAKGKVFLVEQLGKYNHVKTFIDENQTEVAFLIEPSLMKFEIGETIKIYGKSDKIYLFNDDELRIETNYGKD